MALDMDVSLIICACGIFGVVFALIQFRAVAAIDVDGYSPCSQLQNSSGKDAHLINNDGNRDDHKTFDEPDDGRLALQDIYKLIQIGADAFLRAEYKVCAVFIVGFGILVLVLTSKTSSGWDFTIGGLTALAFVAGSVTSMIAGYIGMKVAVFSNARTAIAAESNDRWKNSFNVAFRAGGVMGFMLCGLALLCLYALCCLFNAKYSFENEKTVKTLFDCCAGFGLGGSSIAMFGRVGGGIYTKAADVGADIAGKVVAGLDEDDPRNPACIADNVGDNVGDVAGMGSDLFGSFAEASCAALVVLSNVTFEGEAYAPWKALMFPLMISAVGIIVCALCSFIATVVKPVRVEADVETVLKTQLVSTSLLITAVLYPVAHWSLGEHFSVTRAGGTEVIKGTAVLACVCVWAGLWCGCAIGFITEYYTSHSYEPTREVARSCETGAATNIIYGLALGYKSAIIPVFLLAIVVWVSFHLLDMLGVAFAALGMLSNLATCLSIDVYGPVCDNAGGIAEMSHMPSSVRQVTDALDAAGNTTAAIGKGFAIGSACLVGLALFGAFITRSGLTKDDVSLLDPMVFAFLLIGAMIPYWFSALTMKSVGLAANAMVIEVARQFREIPGLLAGASGAVADYDRCIQISTDASLKEMIAPAVLVMSSPILTGIFFGCAAVAGLLAGAIASSIQMAISASNTGGAWDNAKKYVERGEVSIMVRHVDSDGIETETMEVQGKNSDIHKAAVVGDTVGDPLKDTSGPALNIVMKLMAILSLVFADFFLTIDNGHGLLTPHN